MNRRKKSGATARMREWARSATLNICKISVGLAAVAGLSLAMLDAASFFIGPDDFGVREQVVIGASMSMEWEVLQLASIEPGSNIFLVRAHDVAERVVQHPWIRACWVEKAPPNRIEITVEERIPIAACVLPGTSETYGLDEDGYVLPCFRVLLGNREPRRAEVAREALATVPILTGQDANDLTAGEVADTPLVRHALDTLVRLNRSAPGLAGQIDVLDMSQPGELLLIPREGCGPIRTSIVRTENLDRRLAETWDLLKRHAIEPKYIDARFPRIGLALQLNNLSDRAWLAICQMYGRSHG